MVVVMIVAMASATMTVSMIAATVVVSRGLRASRSGWVVCLSRHVIFPSTVQGRSRVGEVS
jgi:hypothetical protein